MLLEAFGNAASHTYQAAARQAELNMAGAVVGILFVFLIGALLVYTYKRFEKQIEDYDKDALIVVSILVGTIYVCLSLLLLNSCSFTVVTYILNPDWAILQTLSTLIQ